MENFKELLEATGAAQAVATLTLAFTLVLVRKGALNRLRATELPLEVRRRWQISLRNIAIALFVGGAVVIWAEQLRTAAVSLFAVAVAIVLATKEIITCVSGAFLRTTAGGVKLGDRIEIHGIRGDVIDIGALTTTLIEIGPGPPIHQATGRVLVLPNSLFLGESFANESLAGKYVFHTLVLPLSSSADPFEAEQHLVHAATEATADFAEDARTTLDRLANDRNIDVPSADAKVWIRVADVDRVELSLRFVVPGRLRGRVEQEILRRFLAHRGSAAQDGGVPATARS